ncbi:hypothetical protein DMH04_40620 [Kibdelosporangium aridum]|uniref:WD40 repeat domain-containing protein n=2 Tax=Kibdelosporangium aridum TaxID=2030 RepID=A0A428YVR1_KIBAR|nr:hypothetical protein DMH04_40620 [Kibdelosporangium aridum]
MVAVAGLAAALLAGTAVPGAASQPVSPMVTDGDSFVEIERFGTLVHWQRSGETFTSRRTRVNLAGVRAITSLDADTFLAISDDGRLTEWTSAGDSYTGRLIGTGWQASRITAISPYRFLELNLDGDLVMWEFEPTGELRSWLIGMGWTDTKMLIGLDDMVFLEVKHDGTVSEWAGMRERPLPMLNLSDARLAAGLDRERFVAVTRSTDELVEYQLDRFGDYVPTVRGKDWSHAQLIG